VNCSLLHDLIIEGKDLIRATLALIRYLADMRFKLSRWLNADELDIVDNTSTEIRTLFSPSGETQDFQLETTPDTELEEAAELVDTTLFRAYILCRPQLVGPLVRRPNRCIPSVVQEMLTQTHVPRLKSLLRIEIPRSCRVPTWKRITPTSATTLTILRAKRRH
jgi:Vam6/Vps39-like protein vacuolar protein sorting-associated protein 39